jgi:hypothetical protein
VTILRFQIIFANYFGNRWFCDKSICASIPAITPQLCQQPPNAGRNQFDRVPCRITEIDRLAAPRPLDLLFNGDTAFLQLLASSIGFEQAF